MNLPFAGKRAGHLFSKMRLLSAQLLGYLDDDLWLDLARHANAMAQRLAKGLRAAGCAPYFSVDGNMIFAPIPPEIQARLRDAGAVFYPGRLPTAMAPMCALVTAWSTTEADVDQFVGYLN